MFNCETHGRDLPRPIFSAEIPYLRMKNYKVFRNVMLTKHCFQTDLQPLKKDNKLSIE